MKLCMTVMMTITREAYEPETDDIEAESGYDIEAGQDDVDPEQDSEAEQE